MKKIAQFVVLVVLVNSQTVFASEFESVLDGFRDQITPAQLDGLSEKDQRNSSNAISYLELLKRAKGNKKYENQVLAKIKGLQSEIARGDANASIEAGTFYDDIEANLRKLIVDISHDTSPKVQESALEPLHAGMSSRARKPKKGEIAARVYRAGVSSLQNIGDVSPAEALHIVTKGPRKMGSTELNSIGWSFKEWGGGLLNRRVLTVFGSPIQNDHTAVEVTVPVIGKKWWRPGLLSCSIYASVVLRKAGIIKYSEMTIRAKTLESVIKSKRWKKVKRGEIKPGDVIFWRNRTDRKICGATTDDHVGIASTNGLFGQMSFDNDGLKSTPVERSVDGRYCWTFDRAYRAPF